jgi:hypothetical protein
MPTQRYVSPELTHFVGRGLSEDQQYSLLVNDILKAGWLMHPPIDGRQPKVGLSGSPLVGGSRTPDVDDTEAAYWQGICFCDIPVTDLDIHMTKYSRFGLSFLKREVVPVRVSMRPPLVPLSYKLEETAWSLVPEP